MGDFFMYYSGKVGALTLTLAMHETPTPSAPTDATVVLAPSLFADAEITVLPSELYLPEGLILSCRHFIRKRGLPLSELSLLHGHSLYNWYKQKDLWAVNLPICKQCITKSDIFYRDCSKTVYRIGEGENATLCAFFDNLLTPDPAFLYRLCLSSIQPFSTLLLASRELQPSGVLRCSAGQIQPTRIVDYAHAMLCARACAGSLKAGVALPDGDGILTLCGNSLTIALPE